MTPRRRAPAAAKPACAYFVYFCASLGVVATFYLLALGCLWLEAIQQRAIFCSDVKALRNIIVEDGCGILQDSNAQHKLWGILDRCEGELW